MAITVKEKQISTPKSRAAVEYIMPAEKGLNRHLFLVLTTEFRTPGI